MVLPPEQRQLGGIQAAVTGLTSALRAEGVEVVVGANPGDSQAVHHFHALWEPSHARAAFQLRRRARPYVVSPHGMLEPWAIHHRRWKKVPYYYLVEGPFLRNAAAIFSTSEMESEHLRATTEHANVVTLRLGCQDPQGPAYEPARRLLAIPKGARILLFLGRIHVKKGLDILLDALPNGGWGPDDRLMVVGEGDPRYVASLKARAVHAPGGGPRVEWIGPIWGAPRWRYFQAADLFCLPTHSENFGLAVLEALHVGTPVLTTDQTPWSEHRGREGFFISRPTREGVTGALDWAALRIGAGWTDQDRHGLADWTRAGFAWQGLVRSYVREYERIGLSPRAA